MPRAPSPPPRPQERVRSCRPAHAPAHSRRAPAAASMSRAGDAVALVDGQGQSLHVCGRHAGLTTDEQIVRPWPRRTAKGQLRPRLGRAPGVRRAERSAPRAGLCGLDVAVARGAVVTRESSSLMGRSRHLLHRAVEGGPRWPFAGRVKPLSLRTNCSEDARISASVAGGLKLWRVLMARTWGTSRQQLRLSRLQRRMQARVLTDRCRHGAELSDRSGLRSTSWSPRAHLVRTPRRP